MKLKKDEFETIVYHKLENIPERIKNKLENIEFFVEENPPSSRILGLYQGVPFPRRKNPGYSLIMPDKIILFKKNIERECRNKEEIERKIEDVLLHEIGHYLGLNEYQVRKLHL
jgi:predicted Zn-dependent protease with MMP-like domain